MPSETYFLVAGAEPQVNLYVTQASLQDVKELQLDFEFLSVFTMDPEVPERAHDTIQGAACLHRILLLHPRLWFDNQARVLGNELRKLSKEQALLVLDNIQIALRKAVGECSDVSALIEKGQ